MSNTIKLTQQDNPTGSNKRIRLGRQPGAVSAGNSKITLSAGTGKAFVLSAAALTSAGVYDGNEKLIRTLWSGVHYEGGTYAINWDKQDDFGNAVPDGNYHYIVQANNVTSQWEGVIGNTSLNSTGNTVHLGYDFIASVCISGSRLYYATGYSELSSSQAAFDLNNIQVKIPIGNERANNQNTFYNTTDGINVYWAGFDTGNNKSFLYATKVSDNTKVTFANGTAYTQTNSSNAYSAVGLLTGTGFFFTGIAVNSQYIFGSRADGNIYVYDKTGLFIRTIALNTPTYLCVGAADNHLWVVTGGNLCTKYTINSDGTLTATGNQVNLASIGAITANSTTLVLCDKSTQQVKAYNISSLVPLWTLGQAGGYSSSPTVADDKFIFSYPIPANIATSLAFQADGSLWVLDYGNNRLLHFDTNHALIEQMGYIGRFYNSSINLNNPNRILCNWKEYEIDYSKPLQQGWKLVNNWLYYAPWLDTTGTRVALPFRYATLSNGKTYVNVVVNAIPKVYELSTTGLRDTGKTLVRQASLLLKDGSYISYTQPNGAWAVYQYPLTGFDSNSNPLWGAPVLIGTTSVITNDDTSPNNVQRNQGIETTSGKLIFFDTFPIQINNIVQQDGPHRGYHLAAVQKNSTGYQWQTAKSTYTNYTGAMPTDGRFDVGNGVNYNAGSSMLIEGNLIIWGYHGEFWKQTQANIWNMVSDKGLFIGQFGYAQPRNVTLSPNNVAPAGMAGNAFAASLVKIESDLYLYHNDESFHGGLHRWKITGLETIQEIIIT